MLAIFKKELKVYFTSILGYAVMGIYLLVAGIFFYGYFLGVRNTSDFAGFFGDMNTAFLFIIRAVLKENWRTSCDGAWGMPYSAELGENLSF